VKVNLPGGQWAELRDVEDLTTKDRLVVRRAQRIPAGDLPEGESMTISGAFKDEMRIALLASVITAWSYEGWPIPSVSLNPAAMIEQLPIKAYDALTIAIEPHLEVVDYYPSAQTSGESSVTS